MQTPRQTANAMAAARYRIRNPKTEEQKIKARVYARAYRQRPEQLKKEYERKKAWVEKYPEKHLEQTRRAARKKRWGSPEEYATRLSSQNGLCLLCNEPFEDFELRKPVQDHDHKTGALRDFLHRSCNLAIELLKENPEMCRLAAEYLERHLAVP